MGIGKYIKGLVLILFAVLLVGCASDPDVYAEVNGQQITKEYVNRYINVIRLSNPEEDFDEAYQDELLGEIINEHIYRMEAEDLGFQVDPEDIQLQYEGLREEILSMEHFLGSETLYQARLQELDLNEEFLIQLLADYQLINDMIMDQENQVEEPSQEEIESYYELHKDQFAQGESRQIRHILINENNFPDAEQEDVPSLSQELALELYHRLLDGEDFAQLAEEYSQDGSAEDGGDIGLVEEFMLDESFGEVAFDIDLGVVSEPVESAFGWHVLEVVDIKEETYMELDDDLTEYIGAVLHLQEVETHVDAFIFQLKEQAEVERYK